MRKSDQPDHPAHSLEIASSAVREITRHASGKTLLSYRPVDPRHIEIILEKRS